jgi:hypothetical protein
MIILQLVNSTSNPQVNPGVPIPTPIENPYLPLAQVLLQV